MKYASRYLMIAVQFVEEYNGSVPLQLFLKSKFAAQKKYGSKDRKGISHLCYSYYRLGHFLEGANAEERIRVALFLAAADEWRDLFTGEWLENLQKIQEERMQFIEKKYSINISSIFPFENELSAGVDKDLFAISHLTQPDLFIRVRPGQEATVTAKLKEANAVFRAITPQCFAFENQTKLENILLVNTEYVVQDLNSQRVGEFIKSIKQTAKGEFKVWDCCAASGGKAIMAHDLIPNIKLTVSDIRSSILHNLKTRFLQASIKNYNSFMADLTKPVPAIPYSPYDLVICDAPCSGSGTWSRTPEQLYFFKEEEILKYSDVQKQIVSNVIPFIKQGGHLLYVTCSVFRKENEEVVDYIKERFQLNLLTMELFEGYDKKADTMFAALFTL